MASNGCAAAMTMALMQNAARSSNAHSRNGRPSKRKRAGISMRGLTSARAAPGQDWLLEAVEAGRDLAAPANHLQVCFTLGGDTYGWWQATLAAGPMVYYPIGLSRRER